MSSYAAAGDSEANAKKRRRTAKACDFCRKKKVKCDGQTRCSNCNSYGVECGYTYVEKKRAPSKRNSSAKTIKELQSRLGRMEGLIESLVDKLGGPRPNVATETVEEDDSEDETEDEADYGETPPKDYEECSEKVNVDTREAFDEQNHAGCMRSGGIGQVLIPPSSEQPVPVSPLGANDLLIKGGFDPNRTDTTIPDTAVSITHNIGESSRSVEYYFGAQSSFSIFSPRGLRWIQTKLGKNSNLIVPLKDIHYYIHMISKYNLQKWIEPIERNQLTEIPSREITEFLVNCFFDYMSPVAMVDKEEVEGIFALYYGNLTLTKEKIHKRLGYGDMLIMNSILSLAISLRNDFDSLNQRRKTDPDESISPLMRGRPAQDDANDKTRPNTPLGDVFNMSMDEITRLQDGLLSNAIYYYHRISILGDGLKGVQSILLLATYVETTLLTQANYMLVSTAIRLAQELGLHRKESYYGLEEKEAERRRRLWWYCYVLDREICLRSGKPPVIHDDDVSTLSSKTFSSVISKNSAYESRHEDLFKMTIPGVDPMLYFLAKRQGFFIYVGFYFTQLSKITSKAYKMLFSATALKGKSVDQIIRNIEDLDTALVDFKDAIDIYMRPGEPINLAVYDEIKDGSKENRPFQILILHFNYYFHLMIINRIAFKTKSLSDGDMTDDSFKNSSDSDTARKASHACLESARQILRLSKLVDRDFLNYVNWTFFYPFSAFITLFCACIEFPDSGFALTDVELLIDVAIHYFTNPRPRDSKNTLKWQAVDLVVRQMIKIVLKVFENKQDSMAQYTAQTSNFPNVPDSDLKYFFEAADDGAVHPCGRHSSSGSTIYDPIHDSSQRQPEHVEVNFDNSMDWANLELDGMLNQQMFNMPNFFSCDMYGVDGDANGMW